MKIKIVLYIIIGVVFMNSCRNDMKFSENKVDLTFSTDTVFFDTIFTNIGSATQAFTVRNPIDENIKLSNISLAKAENSNYRINVNGVPGTHFSDIIIQPKDSIFIFVEVTIDPDRDEMLEHDSIIFELNGNSQDIDLVAFGQDVHLINDSVVDTQTWTNDKPYLIINSMAVDENETLTLEAGTHLYFHRNSKLIVVGTLKAFGTLEEPVVFEGDRLEDMYFDVPGQWWGIWITKLSHDNYMNYTEVKNANVGIQVDSVITTYPMLNLHNSKIEHHSLIGLYTQGSAVFSTNTVYSDCGINSISLTRGGAYWFYNCTFGNYWNNSIRRSASVDMRNWYKHTDGSLYIYNQQIADFKNCIVWGNAETEINPNGYTEGVAFNYKFENCILKIDPKSTIDHSDTEHFLNNLINKDPKFVDYSEYNFQLDTLSPAKDVANPAIINEFSSFLNNDILGISRLSDSNPDLGAYERVE